MNLFRVIRTPDVPKNLDKDFELFIPARFVCKDPTIYTMTKWSEFQGMMQTHEKLHPLHSVMNLKRLRKNLDEYDYESIYQKWVATKDSGGDGGVWSEVNADLLEMHILQRRLGKPIVALKSMPGERIHHLVC